jgi:hypothetical protein
MHKDKLGQIWYRSDLVDHMPDEVLSVLIAHELSHEILYILEQPSDETSARLFNLYEWGKDESLLDDWFDDWFDNCFLPLL